MLGCTRRVDSGRAHLVAQAGGKSVLLRVVKQAGRHARRQHAVHRLQEALVGHVRVREQEGHLRGSGRAFSNG